MILINPVPRARMGMIERYSLKSLPTAVGVLAGYLLSKGEKVKIVDELMDSVDTRFDDMDAYLKQFNKPYVFGISCLTVNISRGFEIAKALKAKYPDSKVIIGGIHATILPEESLDTGYIDIVVRGEGEETLSLLYKAIKNKQSYCDIEGISFIENGKVIHNPARSLIRDMDALPGFPYDLFDTARYNLDFVITSRGCPYNCVFCSQRFISGKSYRFRSCENVIKEIDLLVNKHNQRSIAFLDDNFLVNKKRVKLLCELIIQNRLHFKAKFGCQTRGDNVDRETLGYLKNAGFNFIGLGMETASERLMKLIDKGETVSDNIKAVRMIKEMGFNVNGFFIFGMPSETSEERLRTYTLAKELKLDYAKFNNIVPYPGTRMFDIAKEEGALNISKNWENFNSVEGVVKGVFSKSRLPYVPGNTTEIELRKDMVRANLYFYLTRLSSLFAPKKGNLGWFLLPPKWYFNPIEYYYLIKLILRVIINCIIVFDMRWVFLKKSLVKETGELS